MDGPTDRRTDRITISISRVSSSMLMCDKNGLQRGLQNNDLLNWGGENAGLEINCQRSLG